MTSPETTPDRMPLRLTLKTPASQYQPEQERKQWQLRRWLRPEKIGPAFWTITGMVSLTVNIILLVILFVLAQQLFSLKDLVQNQLLGGLANNFAMMDQAHIVTSIPVSTTVPAKFDLPLQTNTVVTLTEDTRINDATLYDLRAGELFIRRASMSIVLPKGTLLPVELNLVVPVDQQIPVDLTVAVDIPLNQTDLHQPFVGLQDVVNPYYNLLVTLPDSWDEVFCASPQSFICQQSRR